MAIMGRVSAVEKPSFNLMKDTRSLLPITVPVSFLHFRLPSKFETKKRGNRFPSQPAVPVAIPQIRIFSPRVQWTVAVTPCQVDRVLHVIRCNSAILCKNVTRGG